MKKAVLFVLVLCMILPLCACKARSPVYASYGKYEITQNIYEYWVAYYKSGFYSSFADYGLIEGEYDESVWDQRTDSETTLSQQVTEYVDSLVDEILVSLSLYDELGLKGSEAESRMYETIDELIERDMKTAGSRSELNAVLGVYGMNIDSLRTALEYEAKATIVSEVLFGEGGEYAVTDAEREQYYQQNYHRVKHILVRNDVKYVFDDDGEPKMDIYTGKYMTEELTEEEKAEKEKLAKELYERAKNGEDFEELMAEYSEDGGADVFTDGYFISSESAFDTNYMIAVLTAKDGEIKYADTGYGLMIIKKYPLEAGLWKNDVNVEFFSDMDTNIIAQKKPQVFAGKYAQIKRDEEYEKNFDMKNVVPLDSRFIYYSEEE